MRRSAWWESPVRQTPVPGGAVSPIRFLLLLVPSRALAAGYGLAEEELDLAVDASEFVPGPAADLVPELGGDAEEELLRHGAISFRSV